MSVTGFAPYRPWAAFGVGVTGMALRRTWAGTEGAAGLWLWSTPGLPCPRSGSVSVWRDEEHLRGFVARPDHVRIMRAYRGRGEPHSATWRTDHFDKEATREAARALIGEWSAQPAPRR
ncbi:hypothetical protein QQY24_30180 [Streptomyces sp. TG1A-8]|uniref:hypothetical protein n=1 Tax=Streptomyces sp. TG1A-8 TaxID=3051385 RepID=UPI00265BD811|nr:hypothetical protein [Streptomyces sp. TG1A-8]MDO0929466.1 hypothetical protein [Streptomyces sp. TG1A-8]